VLIIIPHRPGVQVFAKKKYLSVTCIDIKSAFDCVFIPTLILCLVSLQIPNSVCNFLSLLFSPQSPTFSFSGTFANRLTYISLPQAALSCLCPLLFNVYISMVSLFFTSPDFQLSFYADDIVLISSNKSLDRTIFSLNDVPWLSFY